MKKILWGVIIICLPITTVALELKNDYSEAFRLIDVWLDAQRDFDKLPGIAVSVVDDQEILWTGAYGCADEDQQVPFSPSTLGSICSISKLFTSIGIMQLYEQEKLRLDDRIEDLLPWYDLEQKHPGSGPITIRSLLTHSSGLPREANFPYWVGPVYPFPDREQIRSELSSQRTLYPSHTYFQYSNLAMTLLGEVIEEISGMAYDDYVYQHIIGPLQLSETRTVLPEALYGTQLAHGFSVLLRDGTRVKENLFQANGIMAAAGFSSSVTDLATFASWQFQLLDSETPDILRPSTLRYMHNVHYTDPNWQTTWGLGFSVRRGSDGAKWVGHGGYCPGYQSTFQLQPDSKRAYSVLINANGVSPMKYVMAVHEILSKVPAGSTKNDDNAPDLEEFTGYYLYNLSERYLSTWDGKLVLLSLPSDYPADDMILFRHEDGDLFRRELPDGNDGDPMLFERDEEGNIVRFTLHQMPYVRK